MSDRARDIGVPEYIGGPEEAKDFLNNLRLHFDLNEKGFTEDNQRKKYMLGKMRGNQAGAWKTLKMSQEELIDWKTPWKDFVEEFIAYFIDTPGAPTPLRTPQLA